MTDEENERKWVCLSIIAFVIILLTYGQLLFVLPRIDLESMRRSGEISGITYSLLHYSPWWIITITMSHLIFTLRESSRGLWKSGKEELREWLRLRSGK